jgi:hypothetical protein
MLQLLLDLAHRPQMLAEEITNVECIQARFRLANQAFDLLCQKEQLGSLGRIFGAVSSLLRKTSNVAGYSIDFEAERVFRPRVLENSIRVYPLNGAALRNFDLLHFLYLFVLPRKE